MLLHNLKVALRNILKYKVQTLGSILSLAIPYSKTSLDLVTYPFPEQVGHNSVFPSDPLHQ